VDLMSGKKSPLINDGSLNSSPSYSPDGTRIAFSRSLGGNPEIFTCRVDGSGLQRLTHSAGIDTNPAWSPDGKEIAFTSSRAGNPHIYAMDSEGSNLRRITFEGSYNDGAAWSPDGSRIAYASRRRGKDFDIVVTELALLESKVLLSAPGSHEAPSFSPDGRRIAFTTRGGRAGATTQIFAMDADGSHIVQLTRDGNNLAPDWSSMSPR
jgi:TolB protein